MNSDWGSENYCNEIPLGVWPKKLIFFQFLWNRISKNVVTDVDVPEPDEKSVITYISSLYDVFPDVPSVEETLRDNVRYILRDANFTLIHICLL